MCIIITIELPTIIIDLSNSLLARFSIETSWQQDGRDDHFWKGALFHTFWGFPKSRGTAHYHLSYWKTNTHSNFEGLTARLKALSANVATDHHPVCPANKQLIFLSKSSKASHVKEGCIYIYIGDNYYILQHNFFHFIYGMSSFPLTNSYFSIWLLHHQPYIYIYT